jgi:DNA topoisomerase-1
VQIDAPLEAVAEPVAEEPAPIELGKNGKPKKPKKPKKPAPPKPKRQGLPAGMSIADVTLEAALKLLSLPRDVGLHPETGKMIKAGIGRFGPFLLHDAVYSSIPKDDDVMAVGLNRAVVLIAEAAEKRAKREAAGKGRRPSAKKGVKGKTAKTDDAGETAAPKTKKAAGGAKRTKKSSAE